MRQELSSYNATSPKVRLFFVVLFDATVLHYRWNEGTFPSCCRSSHCVSFISSIRNKSTSCKQSFILLIQVDRSPDTVPPSNAHWQWQVIHKRNSHTWIHFIEHSRASGYFILANCRNLSLSLTMYSPKLL